MSVSSAEIICLDLFCFFIVLSVIKLFLLARDKLKISHYGKSIIIGYFTAWFFQNRGVAAALFVLCTGCSTIFPEYDPYANTSLKTLKEVKTVSYVSPSKFVPSLGQASKVNEMPWVVQRHPYISKGISESKFKTPWQQIERLIFQIDNQDIPSITGNVAEKMEAALGNPTSMPGYLEKSLITSHNDYTKYESDSAAIESLLARQKVVDKELGTIFESQLVDIHNLRETIGEIKILEARQSDIQASLPAKQVQLFVDNLAKEATSLHKSIVKKDKQLDIFFKEETALRNELLIKENELRLRRSDQLYFVNDVSSDLLSGLPVLGSGWVQWAAFTLNEENSWNFRDDSLGWSLATFKEKNLLDSLDVIGANGKNISFSSDDIKSAFSWYYSIYSDGLRAEEGNCSLAKNVASGRDGKICSFVPGRNDCISAAIFEDLQIVDDLRDRGFVIYLSGRTSSEPKIGVILGVIDKNHYHVAEYASVNDYFQNELKTSRKDYSGSASKVLYIPNKCSAIKPHVLHNSLVAKSSPEERRDIVLELSLRGQPLFVPIHSVRIEHIPLLMKNGRYSRQNQTVGAGFVDRISTSFLSKNTSHIILTKATFNIVPKGYLAGKAENTFLNMTFLYLLEIDEKNEVIGGLWYVPFTKKDLGFSHRWAQLVKPTGVYYADQVMIPKVGALPFLFSKFRR